jgi:hypothetical protein
MWAGSGNSTGRKEGVNSENTTSSWRIARLLEIRVRVASQGVGPQSQTIASEKLQVICCILLFFFVFFFYGCGD